MKKILMIAFHFHPDLRIGATRSIKFAKYLPEFGWKPIIVTIKSHLNQHKDPAPLGYECDIYRTSMLPTLDDIYKKIKVFLSKLHHDSKVDISEANNGDNVAKSYKPAPVPYWKRFINSLSHTPDSEIGWLLPAVRKSISLIRKQKIEVIFSSGPPWTCHLIALIAKKITRKKWVADFRDPWTLWERAPELSTNLSVKIGKYLEKKVIKNADIVLTTTKELRDTMKKLYYPILEEKCFLIYNGYDEEDFAGYKTKSAKKENIVRILYAGTLYLVRNPISYFSAIRQLLNENILKENSIKADFIGYCEMEEWRREEIISEYGMQNIVKFMEPVSRAEYMHEITNSDILLLIQSNSDQMQIPAKTFEYLATGNEIIALVGKGATNDLLSGYDRVSFADPNNVDQIKDAIKRSWSRLLNGEKSMSLDHDDSLTKRKLTEKLAQYLAE